MRQRSSAPTPCFTRRLNSGKTRLPKFKGSVPSKPWFASPAGGSRRPAFLCFLFPLSPVSAREYQFVEEEYLRRYFRPAPTKTIPAASLASPPPSLSLENPVFEKPSSRSRFGKRS